MSPIYTTSPENTVRSKLLLLAAVPALFCSLIATYFFLLKLPFALPIYLSGVAWAFVVPLIALARTTSDRTRTDITNLLFGSLLITLLLLIAAYFRLHLLKDTPYGIWFDEAQNIIVSRSIFTDPTYRPVFIPDLSQLPAFTFYINAPLLRLFDFDIFGLRLASAIWGILSVAVTGLLAYQFFGRNVGVFTIIILGAMRWHVTFSRFGMVHSAALFFAPLVVLLVLRSLERRSASIAFLAGLACGLAFQTYYWTLGFIILIPLVLTHGALSHRIPSQKIRTLAFAMGLGAVVTYLPVLGYALSDPTAFLARFSRAQDLGLGSTVKAALHTLIDPTSRAALFAGELAQLPTPLPDLLASISKHLLMFHVAGDQNGRHNLPGAPMLDPITGVLFLAGFLLALWRIRDTRYATLLLWIGLALSAGIFSLSFEAPQAGRASGITPPIAILAAIALHTLIERLRKVSRATLWIWLLRATVAAVCASIFLLNWQVYFGRQLTDPGVWSAYSGIETRIGELLRDEPQNVTVFTHEALISGPVQELLGGLGRQAQRIHPSTDIPLSLRTGGAAIVLNPEEHLAVKLLERLYPHSSIEAIGISGHAKGYVARIPAEDITALSAVELWCDENVIRVVLPITVIPDECEKANRWELRGALRIDRFEPMRIALPATRFAIAGNTQVLPQTAALPESAPLKLPIGFHPFKADLTRDIRSLNHATMSAGEEEEKRIPLEQILFNQRAVVGGLRGEYSACSTPTNCVVSFTRHDLTVAHYFHYLPAPLPFRVRWRGEIQIAQPGDYEFRLSAIDAATATLGGKEILRTKQNEGQTVKLILPTGQHPLAVDYWAETGYLQVYLEWRPPGATSFAPVPPDLLIPASAVNG